MDEFKKELETLINKQDDQSDLTQLLYCPFCKIQTDLHITETYSPDKTIIWYRILHSPENICSVSMVDSDKNKLIERWNTRAL